MMLRACVSVAFAVAALQRQLCLQLRASSNISGSFRKNSQPSHGGLVQQWEKLKLSQPQHILMFQVGDFYEMLHRFALCFSRLPPTSPRPSSDAHTAQRVLGITLTRRIHAASATGSIPMAGVPVTQLTRTLVG